MEYIRDLNFIKSKENTIFYSAKEDRSSMKIVLDDIDSLKYYSEGIFNVMEKLTEVIDNSSSIRSQMYHSINPNNAFDSTLQNMDTIREKNLF